MFDARAWLVENGDSGEVLAHSHDRQQLSIASLTKLMTVELALRNAKPGDVVVVDPRAAGVGESSAHLQGGERLTVRELLEAALIQSANDAADALGYRARARQHAALRGDDERGGAAARAARHALRAG